jgi:hypothetical protein
MVREAIYFIKFRMLDYMGTHISGLIWTLVRSFKTM